MRTHNTTPQHTALMAPFDFMFLTDACLCPVSGWVITFIDWWWDYPTPALRASQGTVSS